MIDFPSHIRLILLDRDGVINELVPPLFDRGPRTPSELIFKEDFLDFYSELNDTEVVFAVVTNQPDITRGKLSLEDNFVIVEKIKNQFQRGVVYRECPHDNEDACHCRKPKPGMLLELLEDLSVSSEHAIFIGDSWTDIQAGKAAGIFTVLIESPRSFSATSQGKPREDIQPDKTVATLTELTALIRLAVQ